MTKALSAIRSLLHRLGVSAAASWRTSKGTSPSSTNPTHCVAEFRQAPVSLGERRFPHLTSSPRSLFSTSVKRALLSLPALVLASLAFTAASALAGTVHGVTASFGSEGTAAGQLKEPAGVAVNDKTGDVYVVDRGNNRVDEFEADGTFVRAWGFDVNGVPGLGECTTLSGNCQAGSPGEGPGQLNSPEAIAVDNSGSVSDPSKEDVYVTNTFDNVVEKFSATGEYKGDISTGSGGGAFSLLYGVAVDPGGLLWVYQSSGQIDDYSDAASNAFVSMCEDPYGGKSPGLAVDSGDNLYINRGSRQVAELTSACATISPALENINPDENATAVAVDADSSSAEFGDAYINAGNAVEVFDGATAAPLEAFGGSRHPVSGLGVAVNPGTRAVFVGDTAGDVVDVATLGEAPEAPSTEPATGVEPTAVSLQGQLSPGGRPGALEYQFDYNTGASCTGGQSAPAPAGVLAEAKEKHVEASVTGLEPNALYTYCLVAFNPFGEAQGSEVPFTTEPAAPSLINTSLSERQAKSVRLNATLNPNNEQTTECEFEYGTTAYGSPVPCEPASLEGYGEQGVSAPVTGLTAGETYKYRIVVENATGSSEEAGQFTTATPPEAATAEKAEAVSPTSEKLTGTLDPSSEPKTLPFPEPGSYEFWYAKSASTCKNEFTQAGETAPEGVKGEQAKAVLTGLQPNATYTVCLVTYNNAEPAEAAVGPAIQFTTLGQAPTVEGVSTPFLSSDAATLQASVNPENEPTSSCIFAYGETEGYGTEVPCEQAANGFSGQSVTAKIAGLTRDTAYGYRVQIRTASGESESAGKFVTNAAVAGPPVAGCPNEASRQGRSAGLPDCRAYEQVTPVDKGGAEEIFRVFGAGGGTPSTGVPSEDGDRFLFSTKSALGEEGAAGQNAYLFSRGEDGWTTKSLATLSLGIQTVKELIFDPADLSRVAFNDALGTIGGSPKSVLPAVNLVGPAGGPYATIDDAGTESGSLEGGSTDLGHLVLESKDHKLAPGDSGQEQVPGANALYESAGGAPCSPGTSNCKLINVETDGALISPCGAVLGEGNPNGGAYRAVSTDGAKIFFTAPDPDENESQTGCWGGTGPNQAGGGPNPLVNPPQLYMRLDGESTVNVSAPAAGAIDQTPYPADYVGASANGERVFFVSRGELTADATTGHALELYEYDTETAVLTRVSRGDSHTATGNVVQVPAISGDGSTVYFTAHGQLAPGAPPAPGTGKEGQVSLYRYDTFSETTTYITTIGANEYPVNVADEWYGEFNGESPPALDPEANWYTTADGQYLAFASNAGLTGYDNAPASGVNCTPVNYSGGAGSCAQVYLYSAASGTLVCVSCDPSGAAAVSDAMFARSALGAPASSSPRPVSEDGGEVFFDSADALVPQASSGVLHVYEWHDGELSLIGAPGEPSPSFFLGSTPDGSNVFFGTGAQLVAQDTDQAGDLYDARVDGGFEGLAAPACTGSGCQGVPGAPPIFATPASETFAGIGNFSPAPPSVVKKVTKKTTTCKRGFIRKKVKKKEECVKNPKPKRRAEKSTHDQGSK